MFEIIYLKELYKWLTEYYNKIYSKTKKKDN